MLCKRCGAVLEQELTFCRKCGKAKTGENRIEYFIPIAASTFAYIVFYLILGSWDGTPNFFDWLSAAVGAFSLLLTLAIVPRKNKGVFIASLVVSGWVMASAVFFILFASVVNTLFGFL